MSNKNLKNTLIAFVTIFLLTTIVFGLVKAHNDNKIKFVAVGDNLIHPVVYKDASIGHNKFNFKPMYKNIKPYIKENDVAYINQESPLGGDNIPYSGFKRFNTPSSVANDVIDTGFNLINGSNNHSLDQGTQGIQNGINTWSKYKDKALFTGVFNSQKEHDKVHTLNVKGTKIAMLSYTFGTNKIKPEHSYQVNYLNKGQMKKDIKKAKKSSDIVIVSTHWGKEGTHKPIKKQKEYAKFLANQNVDAVIGMHPHVIQPIKWVKGKNQHKTLVAYSLGNFLNGQATGNESNNLGGSVQFDINKNAKNTKISNVKWRSIVNHYEMSDPKNKDTEHNFKLYLLDKYNNHLAKKHGMRFQKNTEMTKPRLEKITKDVIDDEFLDNKSY